ncbi:MAG: helix-turn-helix domain-containing protein [Candidatus Accumulibacter sp.]|nr:helix-turn-helix domain-containing protein [Accumulibacter sp.]
MSAVDLKDLAATVGQTIARQRVRCGLTQEEVAERLGIGSEAVSRIERGIVIPNVARLVEFAAIFGCGTAELLNEVSPDPNVQANHISQLLAALNPADRRLIVEWIERLAGRLQRG